MCSFPFMPSTGPTLVGHMAVHGLEACRLAKRLTLESLGDSVWNFGLINNMLQPEGSQILVCVRVTGGVAIKNSSPWIPPQSYQIKISGGGVLASPLSSGSTADSDTHHNCRTTVLATRLHLGGQASDCSLCGRWCWLCPGGPGPGCCCCCLSDLLFLLRILCLFSTI